MAALIFDFDGVIADSEALANTVLAEFVTNFGQPTTLDDALARYSGRRWDDVLSAIESATGGPLPADFPDQLKAATLDRFRKDLREVRGSTAFIRRFSAYPRCIASSSSLDRLQLCLSILDLEDSFGANVFSADMVRRGKPHPDIFLFAAEKLGVDPGSCLVIEDSAGGIEAAVAAGMTAVGLCAGFAYSTGSPPQAGGGRRDPSGRILGRGRDVHAAVPRSRIRPAGLMRPVPLTPPPPGVRFSQMERG